jgi:RimJ/RimL family protein N-acetyltransferase
MIRRDQPPGMQAPRVPIETARLTLRPPTSDDAEAVFAYQSDPEVALHLTFPPAEDIAEARTFLARCSTVWAEQSAFPLGITVTANGRFIGMIEPRPTSHGVEVGYVLARTEWGKGYMTEALTAVAHLVLAQPSVVRVWAYVDTDNAGSIRVLEKAGFVREGVLHRWAHHPNASPEPRDALMYARWL